MVGDRPRLHRHDGSSPLPFGMDASPAPTRWTGPSTIWPHDPRSGWSYCVMIPAWTVLPEAKTADDQSINPTVFYRLQVGIQSPEGESTLREILRRFSDFLMLHVALKRTFPRKKLPVPPPKKSLMRMVTNKNHLQERKHALIDWIVKLLADIDVSRSAPIMSFLELEEAARSAIPDVENHGLCTARADNLGLATEGRFAFKDISSTEEGDMLEASSLIPHGVSTEEGETLEADSVIIHGGKKSSSWHRRRLSIDSDASELSFTSGSEFSSTAMGDGRDPSSEGLPTFDAEILKAVQVLLPIDQRGNVRRVLGSLQRRLTTAKADVEDLVARLNQETTVKEFFAAKVRGLEVELEKMKQKSTENLQHAVSMEREGFTNLQWELEETRAALIKAEERSRLAQEAKIQTAENLQGVEIENKTLKQELFEVKEKFQILQVDTTDIKEKARAEMKVLVREIKALRKSQPELKRELELALRTNKELEKEIQEQQKQREKRAKILHEVKTLRQRLQQCTVDFLAKEDSKSANMNNAAVTDAADLLMTSDSRIGLLLAEAQLLAEEEDENESIGQALTKTETSNGVLAGGNFSNTAGSDEPMRKMLTEIFIDNAHLHKLVNSLTLTSLFHDSVGEKHEQNEAPTRKSVLNRFL